MEKIVMTVAQKKNRARARARAHETGRGSILHGDRLGDAARGRWCRSCCAAGVAIGGDLLRAAYIIPILQRYQLARARGLVVSAGREVVY